MGHFSPSNIGEVIERLQKRNGDFSMSDVLRVMKRRKMPVSASEGYLYENCIRETAIEDTVRELKNTGQLIIVERTPADKAVFRMWREWHEVCDNWWNRSDPNHGYYKVLWNIRFKHKGKEANLPLQITK